MRAVDADIRLTDKQMARVKLTKYAQSQSGTYQRAYRRYKVLAKRADQRLVELERAARSQDYAQVLNWAYANAMYDIRKWSGEGRKRFNTAAPKTTQGLLAKIKDIESFLLAPTSKKSSIKKLFNARRDTIKKNYGLDLSWYEIVTLFESTIWKKDSERFGSRTMIKQLGHVQTAMNKYGQDWRNHVKIEDIGQREKIQEFLAQHGTALELILG